MTRNQRRKASVARKVAKDKAIIEAFCAQQRAAIVRRNLASKPARNFYPQSQWATFGDNGARASVCRTVTKEVENEYLKK